MLPSFTVFYFTISCFSSMSDIWGEKRYSESEREYIHKTSNTVYNCCVILLVIVHILLCQIYTWKHITGMHAIRKKKI